MNSYELVRLQEQYKLLPDSELREMLAIEESQYESGVYDLVKQEAIRRGWDINRKSSFETDIKAGDHLDGQLTLVCQLPTIEDADYIKPLLDQADLEYLYTEYHWLGEIRHYEKLPFYTAGIPIEAQISWIPTSFWGMGITAFANLNRRNSVVGILLSKSFGKLK